MRCVLLALSASAVLAGCGDDGNGGSCPAPVDPSFDNGNCIAPETQIQGAFVSWDSSDDGEFCGVNAAQVSIGSDMATTAPNGRFIVCAQDNADHRLAVALPAAGSSQCTTPASPYSTPTLIYLTQETVKAGASITARTITDARRDSFFTDVIGVPFDAMKAHVMVHVDGDPIAVSIDKDHAPSAAMAGTTWATGDTGHDVFFPNVEIGDGRASVSVASGCATASTVPLVAGTISNVTILTF